MSKKKTAAASAAPAVVAAASVAPAVPEVVAEAVAEAPVADAAAELPRRGQPEPVVSVRVTVAGHHKISQGAFNAQEGQLHYEEGDELAVPASVAAQLVERGYVEAVGEAE